MKRQLSFDFENEQYILKENGQIIFSIDAQELKFVSLDFYNGVYKGKSTAIELTKVPSRFMRKIVCRLRLSEVSRQ